MTENKEQAQAMPEKKPEEKKSEKEVKKEQENPEKIDLAEAAEVLSKEIEAEKAEEEAKKAAKGTTKTLSIKRSTESVIATASKVQEHAKKQEQSSKGQAKDPKLPIEEDIEEEKKPKESADVKAIPGANLITMKDKTSFPMTILEKLKLGQSLETIITSQDPHKKTSHQKKCNQKLPSPQEEIEEFAQDGSEKETNVANRTRGCEKRSKRESKKESSPEKPKKKDKQPKKVKKDPKKARQLSEKEKTSRQKYVDSHFKRTIELENATVELGWILREASDSAYKVAVKENNGDFREIDISKGEMDACAHWMVKLYSGGFTETAYSELVEAEKENLRTEKFPRSLQNEGKLLVGTFVSAYYKRVSATKQAVLVRWYGKNLRESEWLATCFIDNCAEVLSKKALQGIASSGPNIGAETLPTVECPESRISTLGTTTAPETTSLGTTGSITHGIRGRSPSRERSASRMRYPTGQNKRRFRKKMLAGIEHRDRVMKEIQRQSAPGERCIKNAFDKILQFNLSYRESRDLYRKSKSWGNLIQKATQILTRRECQLNTLVDPTEVPERSSLQDCFRIFSERWRNGKCFLFYKRQDYGHCIGLRDGETVDSGDKMDLALDLQLTNKLAMFGAVSIVEPEHPVVFKRGRKTKITKAHKETPEKTSEKMKDDKEPGDKESGEGCEEEYEEKYEEEQGEEHK